MEVILVRHGATDWNHEKRCQGTTDRVLSEAGKRQAEALADALRREKIGAVYSSGLLRARHTAEVISAPHRVPVTVEHRLRELDHGALEGLTFVEIKERFPGFIEKWRSEPAELQIPGGERLSDVQTRAWKGLNRIAFDHQEANTVVAVSHNFPILGILCRITDTSLNDYRSFHLDPCGFARLRLDGGAWRITHINNKRFLSA